MTLNSPVIRYLDFLVSDEYKKDHSPLSKSENADFFNFSEATSSSEELNDALAKKIAIITKIQNLLKEPSDSSEAVKFFTPFLDNGWELSRVHSTMLYDLKKAYGPNNASNEAISKQEKEENILKIADMMILSALLQVAIFKDRHIYYQAQVTLEQLLYDKSGYNSLLSFQSPSEQTDKMAEDFRENSRYYNLFRLMIMRLYNVFQRLVDVINRCKTYVEGFRAFQDGGATFFFSYLGLFFIPRLLINMYSILISFFNGKELDFGWKKRLKIRFEDLWAQLVNDIIWSFNGLARCYLLAGLLPIIGVYILIASQALDFIVNSTRSYIETTRLNIMRANFVSLGSDNSSDPQMKKFLISLDLRIEFDKNFLFYTVANFVILLVCVAFMMPAFGAISPVIPLIAGIVAFLTTIFHFRNGVYFGEQRKEKFGGKLIADGCVGVLERTTDLDSSSVDTLCFGKYSQGLVRVKNGKLDKLYYIDTKAEYDMRLQLIDCDASKETFDTCVKGIYLTEDRAKSLTKEHFDLILSQESSTSGNKDSNENGVVTRPPSVNGLAITRTGSYLPT